MGKSQLMTHVSRRFQWQGRLYLHTYELRGAYWEILFRDLVACQTCTG